MNNQNLDSIANPNKGFYWNFFKKKPLVSVLSLSGVIAKNGRFAMNLESLSESIDQAFAFPNLHAVCLLINSPGGSPVQSELIASRIISLSQKKKVPVYSFIEDVGASGGYWLACAGEKIFSSINSIVGSIGVISSSFGLTEIAKKIGIERRIRTQGKNKVISDPFLPENPERIEMLLDMQRQIHEAFIEYVRTRRGDKLTKDDSIDLFDGKIWTGIEGVKLGLVDQIQNLYGFIDKTFGDKVDIKFVKKKDSWVRRRFGIDIVADMADCLKSNVQELFLTK